MTYNILEDLCGEMQKIQSEYDIAESDVHRNRLLRTYQSHVELLAEQGHLEHAELYEYWLKQKL